MTEVKSFQAVNDTNQTTTRIYYSPFQILSQMLVFQLQGLEVKVEDGERGPEMEEERRV
jgi:hypothetical protein